MRDKVSHPYKTTGKIILSYIQSLGFKRGVGQSKGSEMNGSKHSPN
jgi:hypothetical protein